MSCICKCFINPGFNYLRAQMSLSHLIFGKISYSFFIINLSIIFGISKVSLSILLAEILFYGRYASRSTSATHIEWFNTSAILFSLCIIRLWLTSSSLWWDMPMSCRFKTSIVIFIKKNGRSCQLSLRLCVVLWNSHILNTVLNVVLILLAHNSISSRYYVWIHSISIRL